MEVRVARHQSDQSEAFPIPAPIRDREQGGEKGDQPELAEEAVKGTLVEVLAAVRERQHRDDLDGGRGGSQHVRGEGREAEVLECQGEVGLDGRRRDVGDEPNEVQAPDRLVGPSILDVLEGGRFPESGKTFRGVVSQDTLQLSVSAQLY